MSGYGTDRRSSSNADVAAYLLWCFLPFRQSLDVGCAKGFLVEALRELGYDASGADISEFAICQAAPELRPHLQELDLGSRRSRRRFRRRRFDLVTALEVLAHLEPAQVPSALRFLRSISSGWLVATIPSVGVNRNRPEGLFGGKVEPEVLASYQAQTADFVGPVPYDDLLKAKDGFPHEGPQHAINITRNTVGEEAGAAIHAELERMAQRRRVVDT